MMVAMEAEESLKSVRVLDDTIIIDATPQHFKVEENHVTMIRVDGGAHGVYHAAMGAPQVIRQLAHTGQVATHEVALHDEAMNRRGGIIAGGIGIDRLQGLHDQLSGAARIAANDILELRKLTFETRKLVVLVVELRSEPRDGGAVLGWLLLSALELVLVRGCWHWRRREPCVSLMMHARKGEAKNEGTHGIRSNKGGRKGSMGPPMREYEPDSRRRRSCGR